VLREKERKSNELHIVSENLPLERQAMYCHVILLYRKLGCCVWYTLGKVF